MISILKESIDWHAARAYLGAVAQHTGFRGAREYVLFGCRELEYRLTSNHGINRGIFSFFSPKMSFEQHFELVSIYIEV